MDNDNKFVKQDVPVYINCYVGVHGFLCSVTKSTT